MDHAGRPDLLLSAIRDDGRRMIAENPDAISEIVHFLRNRGPVYQRVAHLLLAENTTSDPQLTIQELLDRAVWAERFLTAEFAELVRRVDVNVLGHVARGA